MVVVDNPLLHIDLRYVLWLTSLTCFLQTLYTYPESFRGNKVLIAAQYSGAKLRVVSEPPEFQLGKTNRSEEFLAKFPLGKVGISGLSHLQVLLS